MAMRPRERTAAQAAQDEDIGNTIAATLGPDRAWLVLFEVERCSGRFALLTNLGDRQQIIDLLREHAQALEDFPDHGGDTMFEKDKH